MEGRLLDTTIENQKKCIQWLCLIRLRLLKLSGSRQILKGSRKTGRTDYIRLHNWCHDNINLCYIIRYKESRKTFLQTLAILKNEINTFTSIKMVECFFRYIWEIHNGIYYLFCNFFTTEPNITILAISLYPKIVPKLL